MFPKRNIRVVFYTFVIRGGHIIHQVNIFDVDVVVDVDKLILTKNIKSHQKEKVLIFPYAPTPKNFNEHAKNIFRAPQKHTLEHP